MARKNVARKNNRVTAYQDEIFRVAGPVVYFVGTTANELVKVGHTNSGFRTRFGRLAAQSPVPLMALGVLLFSSADGAKKAEAAIQTMLTNGGRHSHGEWYRLPSDGVQAIVKHFRKLGIIYMGATGAFSVVQETDLTARELYFASLAAPQSGMSMVVG